MGAFSRARDTKMLWQLAYMIFGDIRGVLLGSSGIIVYFVYLLISAYVPGGTQDRLLKASLDGSVIVVGRL